MKEQEVVRQVMEGLRLVNSIVPDGMLRELGTRAIFYSPEHGQVFKITVEDFDDLEAEREMSNFPTNLASLVRRCRRGHEWLPTSNPKMPCPFCAGKTPRAELAETSRVPRRSVRHVDNNRMRFGNGARRK